MARRHKNRTKQNPPSLTLRDIIQRPPDETVFVKENLPIGPPRHEIVELGFSMMPPIPFKPELFAKDLSAYGASAAVIADSNIFLSETDPLIWDALFQNKQLTIVGPVAKEIEAWLHDPRGINVAAHAVVSSAKYLKNDVVSRFSIPDDRREVKFAADWYVNLLGIRKDLRGGIRVSEAERTGTIPNNSKLNDFIKKNFGERAQRLAISGERGKVPSHLYHDEAIVVLGILHALVSKQNTILMTRDENVLEQFRKACWLIDTHYRGMRMAEIYASDPLAFLPIERLMIPRDDRGSRFANAFVDGEVILMTKPSGHLRELLPEKREVVPLHCCLIKDRIEIWTFGLINHLGKIFWMKGQTSGRSTDKFGARNCHIWLGPLIRDVGDWAVIGEDRIVEKGKHCFSMIDANIAMNELEGFVRVLPTFLELPY